MLSFLFARWIVTLKTQSVLNMGSHTPRRAAAACEPTASVRILAAGEIPRGVR
jgi:hypothetical protein